MTFVWVKLGIALVVALGVAAKALGEVSRRANARHRMRSGQRSLADNSVVTLTGIVRSVGEPLIAPLSGTPCVLHRSTARIRGGSRDAPLAVLEHSKFEMTEFILETREGEVIVHGTEADVTIRPGPIIPRKLERETAFLAAAYLEAHPNSTGFDEIVIEPGMKISVHGVARVEIVAAASGEAGFRDAPTRVRLGGDARHPLTIGPL